jgi:hypothetical protein
MLLCTLLSNTLKAMHDTVNKDIAFPEAKECAAHTSAYYTYRLCRAELSVDSLDPYSIVPVYNHYFDGKYAEALAMLKKDLAGTEDKEAKAVFAAIGIQLSLGEQNPTDLFEFLGHLDNASAIELTDALFDISRLASSEEIMEVLAGVTLGYAHINETCSAIDYFLYGASRWSESDRQLVAGRLAAKLAESFQEESEAETFLAFLEAFALNSSQTIPMPASDSTLGLIAETMMSLNSRDTAKAEGLLERIEADPKLSRGDQLALQDSLSEGRGHWDLLNDQLR